MFAGMISLSISVLIKSGPGALREFIFFSVLRISLVVIGSEYTEDSSGVYGAGTERSLFAISYRDSQCLLHTSSSSCVLFGALDRFKTFHFSLVVPVAKVWVFNRRCSSFHVFFFIRHSLWYLRLSSRYASPMVSHFEFLYLLCISQVCLFNIFSSSSNHSLHVRWGIALREVQFALIASSIDCAYYTWI